MCLGEISWHLHIIESDAILNANVPWLWASGNADGTPYHRWDYQQLQMADERPDNSWNVADGVWKGFWRHGAGQSKNRAKRDKLHFCDDSQQNLPHPQRTNCHICALDCWILSTESGPPLHSNYCWGQLNQVSRQTLDKNSQPHHFQADVK